MNNNNYDRSNLKSAEYQEEMNRKAMLERQNKRQNNQSRLTALKKSGKATYANAVKLGHKGGKSKKINKHQNKKYKSLSKSKKSRK